MYCWWSDEEDEQLLVEDELLQAGYDPVVVRVDTAKAMVSSLDGNVWDLLIVDYVMPCFSAPKALELYRDRQLDAPFIVVSGRMGEELAVDMMLAGAHDYVLKQKRGRLLPAIHRELKDASERRTLRQAMKRLQKTEQQLTAITRGALDAIVGMDGLGRIDFWNPAATQLFGYEAEEVLGQDLHSLLVTPQQKDDYQEGLRHYLETGQGKLIGHMVEVNALTKDGREFPVELSLSAVEVDSAWGAVGVIRDISERKRVVKALERLATHDTLTDFYNRAELERQLLAEVSRAHRYEHQLSLLFIDLDHFKTVNDRFGHQVGDALLKDFSGIVETAIRDVDVASRYGGEEFIILLPETDHCRASDMAERLRQRVADHGFFVEGKRRLNITASIGIATFPNHGNTAEELIGAADQAMYRAKELGRDQICSGSEPEVLDD